MRSRSKKWTDQVCSRLPAPGFEEWRLVAWQRGPRSSRAGTRFKRARLRFGWSDDGHQHVGSRRRSGWTRRGVDEHVGARKRDAGQPAITAISGVATSVSPGSAMVGWRPCPLASPPRLSSMLPPGCDQGRFTRGPRLERPRSRPTGSNDHVQGIERAQGKGIETEAGADRHARQAGQGGGHRRSRAEGARRGGGRLDSRQVRKPGVCKDEGLPLPQPLVLRSPRRHDREAGAFAGKGIVAALLRQRDLDDRRIAAGFEKQLSRFVHYRAAH